MKLLILTIVTISWSKNASAANVTDAQSKAKRFLQEEIVYGTPIGIKPPPPPHLQDQQAMATTPTTSFFTNHRPYTTFSNQPPSTVDSLSSKQSTSQSVIYEHSPIQSQNNVKSVNVALAEHEDYMAYQPYSIPAQQQVYAVNKIGENQPKTLLFNNAGFAHHQYSTAIQPNQHASESIPHKIYAPHVILQPVLQPHSIQAYPIQQHASESTHANTYSVQQPKNYAPVINNSGNIPSHSTSSAVYSTPIQQHTAENIQALANVAQQHKSYFPVINQSSNIQPYSTPNHQAYVVRTAESVAVPVQHKSYINHGIPANQQLINNNQFSNHHNNQQFIHHNNNHAQLNHHYLPQQTHAQHIINYANTHQHLHQPTHNHNNPLHFLLQPLPNSINQQLNQHQHNSLHSQTPQHFGIGQNQHRSTHQPRGKLISNQHPVTYPIRTPMANPYTPKNPNGVAKPHLFSIQHLHKPKIEKERINEEDNEEDKENVKNESLENEEGENEEERENYDNDDDNYEDYKFSSYDKEDDESLEDDDGYKVKEEEGEDEEVEDGDNEESTKQVRKYKPKKNLKRINYNYEDSYSNTKFKSKPKSDRSYKNGHSKQKTNGRYKSDHLEGKHSQNVPIVHNQKFFKAKWFVTNSHEESH